MTGFAQIFGGVLCLVLAGASAEAFAAPRKPTADSEILERLPQKAADATAQQLAGLRREFAAAPGDPGVAARLARAYFSVALAQGDPRYVGYADAVLAHFRDHPRADVLLVRGMLRQYRHDFAGALAAFSTALGLAPDLAEAHSWRAAIYLVEADYAAAGKECEALERLGRGSLSGGCRGLLLAYTGRLADARLTLQEALERTRDEDNRLWLLTRLAEIAGWQGQPAAAERFYRRALAIGREDAYLLTAWADFLLDAGRHEEVIRELSGREATDSLLLRLAEAEAKLGRPTLAGRLKALEDRFAAARLRSDTTHLGDEARYRLRLRNDPRGSLQLAVENYRVEREPRDARILLEAALAAGDAAAAAPVHDWLRASGFEDATLRRLAGTRTGGASR